MPQLEVHIIKGVNLPKMDVGIGAKSDPYVIMKIGKQQHQTTIKKKTLNPIWNEKFIFNFDTPLEKSKLKLQMFDQDVLSKDDKMGKASLVLTGLKRQVPTKHSIKIGPNGNLLIELTPLDFGLTEQDLINITNINNNSEDDDKKTKYYYIKTPVDESGNNNTMEGKPFENSKFDCKLLHNYLQWEIKTSEDVLTSFVRSSLVNGQLFKTMKGKTDDNYYYYKLAEINEEGFEEYDEATKEELIDLEKDSKFWKDMEMEINSKLVKLYFVTEFMDVQSGDYYVVYSNKQHLL